MARWADTAPATLPALREAMAERVERLRDLWHDRARTSNERRYATARSNALAARWRSADPMPVDAWELPAWARASLPPSTRVVVLGDGTIDVAAGLGPNTAPVIELGAHQRPGARKEP